MPRVVLAEGAEDEPLEGWFLGVGGPAGERGGRGSAGGQSCAIMGRPEYCQVPPAN